MAAVAGLAATFAPLALTGTAWADALERALLAGLVAWVGGAGRRATLFWAAVTIALLSRNGALVLALLGVLLAEINLSRPRRAKALGTLASGVLANAVFWIPAAPPFRLATGLGLVALLALVVLGRRHMRRKDRRALGVVSAVSAAFLVVTAVAALVAVGLAANNINSGSRKARQALEAVRDGDTERAQLLLGQAHTELRKASSSLKMSYAARATPLVAQQVEALQVAVAEAEHISESADALVAGDYEDLRYNGQVDLAEVGRLAPLTHDATNILSAAAANLERVDRGVLISPLSSRIDEFRRSVAAAEADTTRAGAILDELPAIMGGHGTRRYLVVFTTPAELRGGGGMIGSWVDLEMSNGRSRIARSGRIADLIDYTKTTDRPLVAPKDYLERYGRLLPQYYVQDATLSPNWPSTAQMLANLYPSTGGVRVDGVMAIDPRGLAALLELTGPVPVPGLDGPISAKNAVQLLTVDQYLNFGERSAREEFLADATRATFEALSNASLPSPRRLGDVLGPAARGRHVQAWLVKPEEQSLMALLGATGALDIPTGADGFEVVQQNVGNNKIDAYLQRAISYDIRLNPTNGEVSGTLTVSLANKVPGLDLPFAVVGNERAQPVGANVATLSLHTPLTVKSASLDGAPVSMGPGREAKLFAWDSPLMVIPAGKTAVLKMKVLGRVDLSEGYRLSVLPQPVTNPDKIDLLVTLTRGRFDDVSTTNDSLAIESGGKTLRVSGNLEQAIDITVGIEH